MIHEIYSSGVGQAHFPAAGKRSQLGNGLLLDRGVGAIRILSVHADVLLPSRINPCCGPCVVVNKVRTSFWCCPLFPPSGKLTSACSGGARSHHRNSTGAATWRGCSLCILQVRRTRACSVFRQHTTLVGPTLQLHVSLTLRALRLFVVVIRRSLPGCRPGVMIHIVGSPQVILPTLPTSGQPSLTIFKRTEVSRAGSLTVWVLRCAIDGNHHAGRSCGTLRLTEGWIRCCC